MFHCRDTLRTWRSDVVFRCVSGIVSDATATFSASSAFILDAMCDDRFRIARGRDGRIPCRVGAGRGVGVGAVPDTQWQGAGGGGGIAPHHPQWHLVWVLLALLGRGSGSPALVSNIFMFTFLLTPIIWHADMVPPKLRGTIMRFNPFYLIGQYAPDPRIDPTMALARAP